MTHQISCISYALHSALFLDLEPVKEHGRIWSFELNKQVQDPEPKYRRPHEGEVSVYSFPQSFSSTTLGFGGVGGQAFTTAQMTIVICGSNACVYVNGRLAYKINTYNEKFWQDLSDHNMRTAMQGKSAYEGKKPE